MILIQFAFKYSFYTRTMLLPRTPLTGATVYADDVALWASVRTPSGAWALLESQLQKLLT